ncbi:MAG: FecR domain-containing protein [Bacteroidota bacterium]
MKEDNQALLDKLLNDSSFRNWAKNSNRNDVAFWDSWIRDNPDHIDMIDTAKSIILGISFEKKFVGEEVVDEKLTQVLAHIQNNQPASSETPVRALGNRITRIGIAAAIGLVFMVVAFNLAGPSDEIIHKTDFGEVLDLRLPDGTTVVLNGNSEIRYNKENSREITLQGEAYFKVKSMYDTKSKFWVNTDDLRVEVYGTQFHVNTRDKKTDVALDEGSIHLLLKNGSSKKMAPGEFVSYSDENNSILHEKVDPSNTYALWREGTYVFSNIKLRAVMKYIEHTYGLPSEFKDVNTEEKTLTGGIPNENLSICLSAIEKSTGTKIIRKNNKLIIHNDQ